jgi:hypothetical protein
MNPTKFLFVSYLVAIILFAFCGASALADEADVDSDLYGAWELMKLEIGGNRRNGGAYQNPPLKGRPIFYGMSVNLSHFTSHPAI